MTKYVVSPNEEERLLKEERNRRRLLRLHQVRQQSLQNARYVQAVIREETTHVSSSQQECTPLPSISDVIEELEVEWWHEREMRINALESEYTNSLKVIGDAHRDAEHRQPAPDKLESRRIHDANVASRRYQSAIKKLHHELEKKYQNSISRLLARQAALEIEAARAKKIARLPSTNPQTEEDLVTRYAKAAEASATGKTCRQRGGGTAKSVRFEDPLAQSARTEAEQKTKYEPMLDTEEGLIPRGYVSKAGADDMEVNALDLARETSEILIDNVLDKHVLAKERHERARIRGLEAMRKEKLKREYDRLLDKLKDIDIEDRKLRQQYPATDGMVSSVTDQYVARDHTRQCDRLRESALEGRLEVTEANVNPPISVSPMKDDARADPYLDLTAEEYVRQTPERPLEKDNERSTQAINDIGAITENVMSSIRDRIDQQRENWLERQGFEEEHVIMEPKRVAHESRGHQDSLMQSDSYLQSTRISTSPDVSAEILEDGTVQTLQDIEELLPSGSGYRHRESVSSPCLSLDYRGSSFGRAEMSSDQFRKTITEQLKKIRSQREILERDRKHIQRTHAEAVQKFKQALPFSPGSEMSRASIAPTLSTEIDLSTWRSQQEGSLNDYTLPGDAAFSDVGKVVDPMAAGDVGAPVMPETAISRAPKPVVQKSIVSDAESLKERLMAQMKTGQHRHRRDAQAKAETEEPQRVDDHQEAKLPFQKSFQNLQSSLQKQLYSIQQQKEEIIQYQRY